MTDQRDTPDTRTPSGEPRLFSLVRDEDVSGVSGTGVVADGIEFPDGAVALRWRSAWPTSVVFHDRGMASVEAVHGHAGKTRIVFPGQGSDAPSAPNRAPTDALVARLREEVSTGGYNAGPECYAAADALEDLTRENERLRAELAEVGEAFQNGVHQEEPDGRCICGNEWICLRWCEPSPEDYADVAAAAGRLEVERDDLRRQVAAVRALCDEAERQQFTATPAISALRVRAALDTAADRRSEDGYGTDNVPGGWGGSDSQGAERDAH